MPDTGFAPKCNWVSVEAYQSGAIRFRCTLCGKEVVIVFQPFVWIMLDFGDADKHTDGDEPGTLWVEDLNLGDI